MVLVLVGLFVLGLVMGSFASVLAARLPEGKSWRVTRSACPQCGRTLAAADLVPIVSFALLQGKCRYCKKAISLQYPLLELGMAAAFVGIGFLLWPSLHMGAWLSALALVWVLVLVFITIVLVVTDLSHSLLPDGLIFAGIWATLLYKVVTIVGSHTALRAQLHGEISGFGAALFESGFLQGRLNSQIAENSWAVVGALLAALVFCILIAVTRGKGMGLGDVKLVFLIGIVVGWPQLLIALFIAFVTGAAVAIVLVVSHVRTFGQTIPFGPFLLAGGVISFVYGSQLLEIIGY